MANKYLKYKCTFFTELVLMFAAFSNQLLYMNQRKISRLFPRQFFQTNSSRFVAREHI